LTFVIGKLRSIMMTGDGWLLADDKKE
jgi:hypothetical protein